MQIAVLLFDGLTALDALGPYEVLSRLPGAEVRFVAAEPGPKRDNAGLTVVAEAALDDVPAPDIVVVPGGPGEVSARADGAVLEWVRSAHQSTRWTTSVCTGALLLAAAGLLDGTNATTHWMALDELASLGARPVQERVVIGDRLITSAGVSAGIDMALRLAELEAGPDVAQAIQLVLEYDPQPPSDAGSPAKAPPHVVDLVWRGGGATGAAQRWPTDR